MTNLLGLEKSLTISLRLGAVSLLVLSAFLVSACQGLRTAASPAPLAAASACGEGMLAAQAWKCLASGAAHP